MIGLCKKAVIVILLLCEVLGIPVGLYFTFRDFSIYDAFIGDIFAILNIITAGLLFLLIIVYSYSLKWFSVFCYPVSLESLNNEGASLVAPVHLFAGVALFQGKWIILAISAAYGLLSFLVWVIICGCQPDASHSSQESSSDDENEPLIRDLLDHLLRDTP